MDNKLLISIVKHINYKTPINQEFYVKPQHGFTNEFLLILKPELFTTNNRDSLPANLSLIFEKLEKFGMHISNARVFNAEYLKKYMIIDKHYGVINAVAKDPQKNISRKAKASFSEIYGKAFDDATVVGGLECLANNIMDENTLSILWSKAAIKRLAGGVYAGKTSFEEKELYIINGFHPPQLKHFIDNHRMIITMNLCSNTPWEVARQQLIGNTYPQKAAVGSIRGALYRSHGNFGFDVSYVINSIHLSAGPLEGLAELMRFNTNFEDDKMPPLKSFVFGKIMLKHFSKEQVMSLFNNPMVQYNGQEISIFDLTEEKDAETALELIKFALG